MIRNLFRDWVLIEWGRAREKINKKVIFMTLKSVYAKNNSWGDSQRWYLWICLNLWLFTRFSKIKIPIFLNARPQSRRRKFSINFLCIMNLHAGNLIRKHIGSLAIIKHVRWRVVENRLQFSLNHHFREILHTREENFDFLISYFQ
jgi:hypothetical protein